MYKIAVVGDKDSVYGFSSVGAEIHIVNTSSQAKEELKTMLAENYAIIFITETLLIELNDVLTNYKINLLPAIVPIPGISENTNFGTKNIDELVEKTIGTQWLS